MSPKLKCHQNCIRLHLTTFSPYLFHNRLCHLQKLRWSLFICLSKCPLLRIVIPQLLKLCLVVGHVFRMFHALCLFVCILRTFILIVSPWDNCTQIVECVHFCCLVSQTPFNIPSLPVLCFLIPSDMFPPSLPCVLFPLSLSSVSCILLPCVLSPLPLSHISCVLSLLVLFPPPMCPLLCIPASP